MTGPQVSSTVPRVEAPKSRDRAPAPPRAELPWPTLALALAMAVAAAGVLHLTRGFTFYYDEWNFIVNRQDFTADALFLPHNEHMVLVPVLAFKGLWELAGLDNYWVFRLVVVGLHLLCAVLVYLLARRRLGDVLALAPAVVLLFLGTAWEVILWPFEIQFLIPTAAGLGVLLALERQDLKGDLAAGGLLLLAFGSGSLGVPVAVGASVEILFGRRRVARLLRVIAPPVALYALWLYEYDPYRHQYGSIGSIPKFAAEQLGSVLAGIAGFRYGSVRPVALVLAIALVVLVAERLVRRREGRARLAALAAMALTYWGALALYRPWVLDQQPSRFLYAGSVFALLIAVELARGRRPGRGALAVVGVLVALAVASNFDDLRDGAHNLRDYSDFVQPGLGALELARGTVDPAFRPEPTRAPDIVADEYFEASDRFGSPADSPDEILRRTEPAREAADIVLVSALRLELRPLPGPRGAGPAPSVDKAENGTSRSAEGCVRFTPPNGPGAVELRIPAGGMTLATAPGPPVQLFVRRFGAAYVPDGAAPAEPLFATRQAFGRGLLRSKVLLAPGGRAVVLRIPRDGAPQPWRARLAVSQRVVACGI
jgi:hypothetical protein